MAVPATLNPGTITYANSGTPSQVGSPAVGMPPLDSAALQNVPFRIATTERADQIQADTQNVGTTETQLDRTVPGTGYVFGFELDYNLTTASNAATVAYAEDAPYAAASSVIFRDTNGEIVDADGFSLKLMSRYGGWEPFNQENSLDTSIWVAKAAGAGGTAGSFRFKLKVPVALNRRTLLGVLGNQDRGQQYLLRANLAASGSIYTTPPTNAVASTVTRVYESYAVPNPVNADNAPQQVIPPFYGVIPYLTKSISSNAPAPGQQTHYLQRLNTTFRELILVLRSNGSRATAESNLPTNVLLKIGNQSIFNEPVWYRREKMFDRFGFDAPAGVLVYDMLHDFGQMAGSELGHDYYWTQQLAEATFLITYPAGFGSTNNSLTVLTSDMVVPNGMNLYVA